MARYTVRGCGAAMVIAASSTRCGLPSPGFVTRSAAVLAAACLALAGCDHTDPYLPFSPATTCAAVGGSTHSGVITNATWRRQDGPHRVEGVLSVTGSLTIEAGTLVCGAPGATIAGDPGSASGRLVAHGTAERPITFAAAEHGTTWGGIVTPAEPQYRQFNVDLAHVVIEDAAVGVRLGYMQFARLRQAVIRRTTGPGVTAGTIHLTDVVVDSACLGASPCYAVSAPLNEGGALLERVRILRSGGGGFLANGRATNVDISDLLIEGSAGVGFYLGNDGNRHQGASIVRAVPPIIIRGGGSYPANIHTAAISLLLPTLAAQAQWLGNSRDTLLVRTFGGALPREQATIGPDLPWRFEGPQGLKPETFKALRILAGGSITLEHGIFVDHLDARGTAAAPVSIVGATQPLTGYIGGIRLTGPSSTPSLLEHARLENAVLDADPLRTVIMSDIVATGSYIALGAQSRLTRALLRGGYERQAGPPNSPWNDHDLSQPLRIIGPDVSITECDVSRSRGDGVVTDVAAGVRVHQCNIHGNAAAGIRNLAADSLDARHNWWGGPAGPGAAGGNTVTGPIRFEPFLLQPHPSWPVAGRWQVAHR
jgi:hypothetical protein